MNLLYQRIGRSEGISKLLHHFYADVRQDPLIGPIFNVKIKDWKHHLEIITSFWETLIGGPRTYARAMPIKHLPLGLREEHFERWLFSLAGKLSCSTAKQCCQGNERFSLSYRPQASKNSLHLK
jgi:truncated hemoglobin YjbI